IPVFLSLSIRACSICARMIRPSFMAIFTARHPLAGPRRNPAQHNSRRAAPGWRHRRGPGRRPGRHTAIRNRSWLLLSLGGLIPGAVVPMDAPVALGKTGLHLAAEALLGDVRHG